MPNIPEMILSAILKKGVIGEVRNCDVTFEVPSKDGSERKTKINVKAEHITLRVIKEKEDES